MENQEEEFNFKKLNWVQRRLEKAELSEKFDKITNELQFLKRWALQPTGNTSVGAIKPSSKALAELMVSYIDPHANLPIVELGPGTGVFTKALLERGVPPENLYLVEYDDEFYENLKSDFPKINLIQGDAYDHQENLKTFGIDKCAAVLSGLPMLLQPVDVREKFCFEVMDSLEAAAPFVQFSYGAKPPWAPKNAEINIEKSKWVTLNLPPARVWVYKTQ